MIKYLLPLLIGYTGGRMVHGQRGAVVGAVATIGVVVGADIPMFLGAMIIGPLTAYVLKQLDELTEHRQTARLRDADRQLQPRHPRRRAWRSPATVGSARSSAPRPPPQVTASTSSLTRSLLPLVSLLVEPAKVLFLNNAINHGVLAPLGVDGGRPRAGKSILFMVETNPGPGLGVLLAYMLFGPRSMRPSVPGAMVIHFLGGIHEIYFPYVLMKPKLILGAIAGGASRACCTAHRRRRRAGRHPVARQHLRLPRGHPAGRSPRRPRRRRRRGRRLVRRRPPSCSASATVEDDLVDDPDADSDGERSGDWSGERSGRPPAPPQRRPHDTRSVINGARASTARRSSKVIVACDAGMGSSVMLASQLRKTARAVTA